MEQNRSYDCILFDHMVSYLSKKYIEEINLLKREISNASESGAPQETINPFTPQQKNSELVKRIREAVGYPAHPNAKVSRDNLKLSADDKIHLDIGGEGKNEHLGFISGFDTSININDLEYQSNHYGIPIPNLVRVQRWFTDPGYPFADGFADYITMQNAPLTAKNVAEIARCLRPGGIVELWIYHESFTDNIRALAEKLESKVEYDITDEFEGSTGSPKIRIISGIKPKPHTEEVEAKQESVNSDGVSFAAHRNRFSYASKSGEPASSSPRPSKDVSSPPSKCPQWCVIL
jgi:hypothetical protein